MKKNITRALVALTAIALCLSASPALAASHAKHACVKGVQCTYSKTGKHNTRCERGTHTAKHAGETRHSDANGHDSHK